MSGRRKRTQGLVRVVCTDGYHRDTAEFARYGFHRLCPLVFDPAADPRLTLDPKSTAWMRTSRTVGDFPVQMAPVKSSRRADGQWTYQFRCSCGLDLQRLESGLMDHVTALLGAAYAADPRATRVDLDITTI